MVETEFAARLYSDNADKAVAVYTKFKVNLLFLHSQIIITGTIFHLSLLLQPLEAIDVANSVTYVLSAPPHVQVCDVVYIFQCFL